MIEPPAPLDGRQEPNPPPRDGLPFIGRSLDEGVLVRRSLRGRIVVVSQVVSEAYEQVVPVVAHAFPLEQSLEVLGSKLAELHVGNEGMGYQGGVMASADFR